MNPKAAATVVIAAAVATTLVTIIASAAEPAAIMTMTTLTSPDVSPSKENKKKNIDVQITGLKIRDTYLQSNKSVDCIEIM